MLRAGAAFAKDGRRRRRGETDLLVRRRHGGVGEDSGDHCPDQTSLADGGRARGWIRGKYKNSSAPTSR